MIEVKNLVKSYDGFLAVDHLNFTVKDGQIYGFLGPNGAGKSTTMNMMTGYLGATEGEIIINGHDILEDPEEAKKCIGYLPEVPPLYTDMTVLEYLTFASELKQIPKKDRLGAIMQAMEKTKLVDVQNRLIRNLSKGYRQRVGLAQAIMGLPPVIILDEPTVGLDPKQIIEIRELIKDLAKNHTVILSSHILAEISAVCDMVMIINKGKLVACDTPENLEKKMAGTNGISMEIKGSKSAVQAILEREKEITDLSWRQEDQYCQVYFQLSQSCDNQALRERLFYYFAEAKLPIISMQLEKVTLEDVFLELTDVTKQQEVFAQKKKSFFKKNKKMTENKTEGKSVEGTKSEGKKEETDHAGDL
ncbi:MAG: ABC transporter ATP-binding protein [Lachnospiraceae bacterium]